MKKVFMISITFLFCYSYAVEHALSNEINRKKIIQNKNIYKFINVNDKDTNQVLFNKITESDFTTLVLFGMLTGSTAGIPYYLKSKSFSNSMIAYGISSSIGVYYYGKKKYDSSFKAAAIGTIIGTTCSYVLIKYALPALLKSDNRNSAPHEDTDSDVLGPIGLICVSLIIPPAFGVIGFDYGVKGHDNNYALINYNNQKMNFVFPQVYIAPSISNSKKVMYKVNVFSAKL